MRLDWQCPVCFAELGDKSHARMLTCPYCGSLLIVKPRKKEFYLVKRKIGWYYFKKKEIGNFSGYLKYGEHEEYYKFRNGEWYLKKNDWTYRLIGERNCDIFSPLEEGKVEYIWGELPIVAPPESIMKNFGNGNTLCKSVSGKTYLFEKIENKKD